jgi:hypothetical protein
MKIVQAEADAGLTDSLAIQILQPQQGKYGDRNKSQQLDDRTECDRDHETGIAFQP